MSELTDPEYWFWETCPPYEAKLAVVGAKAIQLKAIALITVVVPKVTLNVKVVFWRLVGLTDT